MTTSTSPRPTRPDDHRHGSIAPHDHNHNHDHDHDHGLARPPPAQAVPAGEPQHHAHAAGLDHSHGHAHDHAQTIASTGLRAFALGTLINLGFTAIEATYGLITGSLALLSDALHNLGDALGLALAWAAARLALRPASARRTYGYRRATVLAPLANSLLLVAGAGALGWEAFRRIAAPPAIDPWPVIVVAGIGIFVNLGSALLFRHGHAHDLNQRGAYLHLIADALVSVAVVLGTLGVIWTGWRWLDPVLALGVVVVVAMGSWGLLRDSLDLALDAVPRNVDRDAVLAYLATLDGVAAVHHLHIWALGSRETALTAHLVRPSGDDDDAFLCRAADELGARFGIGHTTLQIERGGRADCAPCA